MFESELQKAAVCHILVNSIEDHDITFDGTTGGVSPNTVKLASHNASALSYQKRVRFLFAWRLWTNTKLLPLFDNPKFQTLSKETSALLSSLLRCILDGPESISSWIEDFESGSPSPTKANKPDRYQTYDISLNTDSNQIRASRVDSLRATRVGSERRSEYPIHISEPLKVKIITPSK